MCNSHWLDQEKIFLSNIAEVEIPNGTLEGVDSLEINDISDLERIPDGGGCYWIWTNEPVSHFLHKHQTPTKFYDGEIIYNGIAKDNVKGRIKHHLLGEMDARWSGISVDIYTGGDTVSHRKRACSDNGKVPFIKTEDGSFIKVCNKADLLRLDLSSDEESYIENSAEDTCYFRNGINVTDAKHSSSEFKVYYIVGLGPLFIDFIEKKWREEFGLPKLCSYSSGR